MCRIAGIVNFNWSTEKNQQTVENMCNLLIHGGPDDGGIFTSENGALVLGNRRLALVDLSQAGHQPMHYQNRFTITYNGELYNYLELKNQLLQLGHQFSNHTDTEVILAAFAEWNVLAFEKFNGMYAFALYDQTNEMLYVVRDAVGIKPLYYSVKDEQLVFASELNALKNVDFNWTKNENWPVFLMAYGHIPEPYTTFNEVSTLHKGSFIKYDLNTRKHSIQSYSFFSFSQDFNVGDNLKNTIRNQIENAVKSQLVADAPVGVFLSGGIDSSILALIADQHKKEGVQSLSIYFNENEYSEKKYQDIVMTKLKGDKHQFLITKDDFEKQLPNVFNSMDLPSCDGINTWFISKYAKELGLKAVLSGIGADELFGGYPSFQRMNLARKLSLMPNSMLQLFKKNTKKPFNRIAYLSMDGIKGIYLFMRGHYNVHEIATYLEADEREIWNIINDYPMLGDVKQLPSQNQASWMEFNLYMQNQLLKDADVMSMAHGVEIRVPFLDKNLIKSVLNINAKNKYSEDLPKQLLIDSCKDILPEQVWNRKKMGFGFPFSNWMKNNEYLEGLMQDSNKNTKQYYHEFKNGNLHWSQMMSLMIMKTRNEA
jgi:asparagine synthase (glutamine-hydrolysing)